MAVAVDATGTEQHGSAVTSLGYTGITVGSGSNRALVVTFGISNGTAPTGVTATWDNGASNQAMTSIAATANTFVFALRNPIAGNKTLQIAWTNANEISACAISFTGVDQTSDALAFPHNNTSSGSSTTASLVITSATGNIPVTSVWMIQVPSAPNQTQIYLNSSLVNCYGAQRATGAASVTFNWTSTPSGTWLMAGCDVAAAGAGGSPVIPYDVSDGPHAVRRFLPDASKATNLNLFKNPIPFGPFDYSDGPHSVRRFAPDASKLTNLNLFKNPIPFGPYDYGDGPWRIKPIPLSIQPYNQSLYSVTVAFDMMGQIWL